MAWAHPPIGLVVTQPLRGRSRRDADDLDYDVLIVERRRVWARGELQNIRFHNFYLLYICGTYS